MNENVRPATPIARVVLASFIGTSIEWYDFFLYGTAAALVFNKLFFPTLDPFAGTMASFATYAVGFFARPLGGIVFGHYGDKIGRRSTLVTTLTMMGLSTFLIGLLPTYDQIGVLAPVALAALRLVQGLGVGGEWGGAVVLVVEHGHRGRRGLYASSAQAGVPAGLLLANGTFAAVSALAEDQFLSWGWRVPFLAGAVLLGLGLFIRLHILETPLFAQAQARRATSARPLVDLVRNYPRNLLLAMGAASPRTPASTSSPCSSTYMRASLVDSRGTRSWWVSSSPPPCSSFPSRRSRRCPTAWAGVRSTWPGRCSWGCSPSPSSGWWTAASRS